MQFSVTGGELFDRIASEETVTEKECVHYMRQLLEGLQYIHRMNIVHLDLKVIFFKNLRVPSISYSHSLHLDVFIFACIFIYYSYKRKTTA